MALANTGTIYAEDDEQYVSHRGDDRARRAAKRRSTRRGNHHEAIWPAHQPQPIGVDIAADAVRLLQVETRSGQQRILRHCRSSLPLKSRCRLEVAEMDLKGAYGRGGGSDSAIAAADGVLEPAESSRLCRSTSCTRKISAFRRCRRRSCRRPSNTKHGTFSQFDAETRRSMQFSQCRRSAAGHGCEVRK